MLEEVGLKSMNIKENNSVGAFSLVLHAHLPYVLGHGTWPHGVDWLNEAAVETYLPLLNVFNRLKDEGISAKVTIDISPVLTEMLAADEFRSAFKEYLAQKALAAAKDIEEFTRLGEDHMAEVGRMWKGFYEGGLKDFTERYGEDILKGFKELQDAGHIEITTCGATHGYFPLLSKDSSILAQVAQAVKSYKRHFGRTPRGMWLPECAYRPSYDWKSPIDGDDTASYPRKGVEEFLSENGIEYFFVDSHLLKGGKAIGVYADRFEDLQFLWDNFSNQYQAGSEPVEPRSPYGVYLAASTMDGMDPSNGKAPVAVFTRDNDTGLQVWSGDWGYPGDANYLDFHKKRFPGGLRYWAVTDTEADLADKGPYYPEAARGRIPENAEHFKDLVKEKLRAENNGDSMPLVCSPYDAELFGHWWFEGAEWIYHVIKAMATDTSDDAITLTTASEYLDMAKPSEVVSLPEGSWGEGGYHWVWLNDMNKWTWKHIYDCEEEMESLALLYGDKADAELMEILKQTARELMLMQASDWQFLISTRAAADYAETRIVGHYEDFLRLAMIARGVGSGEVSTIGEADRNFLKLVMERDSLFTDIDINWFMPTGVKLTVSA